jgi:4-hydroxythreonine-4-phosphate dehydrogenase
MHGGRVSMHQGLPVLALAAGDPAGVGPEIVVKALAVADVRRICRPVVIGWENVIRDAAAALYLGMRVRRIRNIADARFEPDLVDVYEATSPPSEGVRSGPMSAGAGLAGLQAMQAGARLALEGKVAGVVTAPLSKGAISLAGFAFTGHADAFAEAVATSDYAVMVVSGKLRVVQVSTHVSLQRAIELVTRERVLRVIRLAHDGCIHLGIQAPVIAVAGLNPHAGEDGPLGDEEAREIAPAIKDARASGIDAVGPLPADIAFLLACQGRYAAVVAMYHDQGYIAVRVAMAKTGVNIPLGLPIVSAAVGHGPSFEMAGKGLANPADIVEAIRLAACMATRQMSG